MMYIYCHVQNLFPSTVALNGRVRPLLLIEEPDKRFFLSLSMYVVPLVTELY
jgi:hypothetical protein